MAITEPRFPTVPENTGHYESFYLKASRPGGGLGVWIRYTVHKRPGGQPKGSLWFTLFDAEAQGPRASKVTSGEPRAGPGVLIAIGDSALEPGEASGSAVSERSAAAWELRFGTREAPLRHLPARWLYRAPLPRTKLLSPYPAATFEGRLEVDGREIAVNGWRGMMGHNWGSEHAERWIWLHGLGFEGREMTSWLDVAIGRVRLGPLTSPWIANGALSLDGERYRLGGPAAARGTRVRESSERCKLVVPGRGVTVRGEASAPPRSIVGWLYADPNGGHHHTTNCSIADIDLRVDRPGASPVALRLAGEGAYELGRRDRDPAIEYEPFPDG